jgi:hypothetical protein
MVDSHYREEIQKEVDHRNLLEIIIQDKVIIKDQLIIIFSKEIISFI